ncbi:hypothetical protein H6A24_13270 [Bacteroides caecicola]|uniref:Uncharacterized protein n=1 Tax=Bacteroides caecicola TaxID=1462569 RepID=A0ABS2FB06_9BACE|nr:hypothetical protein [Bacteroides caecicola]MBM6807452.1 hypothetical protein [Bacteroides caecicola]
MLNVLLSIILLVFGVLQIILFFKLWGMTNDVRSLKDKYTASNKELEYYIKSINEYLRKIEASNKKEGSE